MGGMIYSSQFSIRLPDNPSPKLIGQIIKLNLWLEDLDKIFANINLMMFGFIDMNEIKWAIEDWQNDPELQAVELHEYLGLTEEQYARWIESER
jgi:hypothetical protein